MHSCLYLQVSMYRDGPKTDCSTVLGLFTSRSEGEVNVITTDVGVKGHMHKGSEKAHTAEYNLDDEDTEQNTAKEHYC